MPRTPDELLAAWDGPGDLSLDINELIEALRAALKDRDQWKGYGPLYHDEWTRARALEKKLELATQTVVYYRDADYLFSYGTGIALDRGRTATLALKEMEKL